MYTVKANTNKNRLYLELKGKLDSTQVYNGALEVFHQASMLKQGFTTIFNIKHFEPATEAGSQAVQMVLAKLINAGQGTLVRIVSNHSGEKIKFNNLGRVTGYPTIDVLSEEEAEIVVEELRMIN